MTVYESLPKFKETTPFVNNLFDTIRAKTLFVLHVATPPVRSLTNLCSILAVPQKTTIQSCLS